jgi:hypothetical protein
MKYVLMLYAIPLLWLWPLLLAELIDWTTKPRDRFPLISKAEADLLWREANERESRRAESTHFFRELDLVHPPDSGRNGDRRADLSEMGAAIPFGSTVAAEFVYCPPHSNWAISGYDDRRY